MRRYIVKRVGDLWVVEDQIEGRTIDHFECRRLARDHARELNASNVRDLERLIA